MLSRQFIGLEGWWRRIFDEYPVTNLPINETLSYFDTLLSFFGCMYIKRRIR